MEIAMNRKMPTPEAQSAYDAAYEIGLRGEDLPEREWANTQEDAAAHLATVMGHLAGLNEHYKRKGIRTSFFNDDEDVK
jgi:hypothetical protein